MHLLFVHERFVVLANAETIALLMVQELQRRGHFTGHANGVGSGLAETVRLEVFTEPFGLGTSAGGAALGKALARIQPDVVYLLTLTDAELLDRLERLFARAAEHAAMTSMN